MRVGLISGSRMFPAAAQKAEVEAAGVGRLYERNGEKIDDVIKGIRAGNTLVIAGLYALGLNRADVFYALEKLAAKRITVERARDGSRADTGSMAWYVEDMGSIAGAARVKSRSEARKRGAKGGRPPIEKPMSDEAMLRIWRKHGLSTGRRADLIGLPVRQVYRWLKEIETRQNSETE
jgi:DNA invertase Pin-like site-specific DNA recombinase